MPAFTLTIDAANAQRIAMEFAVQTVTETTRRVFNRAQVLTPVKTGNLRAHNQMRVLVQGTSAVGEVFNDTVYADPVHNGSRAHTIRPRRAKALRFVVGGRVVYAQSVRMPARRGRPWLRRALVEIAGPEGYDVTTL